ncbi:MAG: Dihydroxyacetone kinase-like protein, phosphatase domain / Dihydroxyacetone kinase-like protein, kinase domain [uncultured Rubrobacteraceae bacterium]|uniref:Dihydroxyacetone kinase-like protein, phosphatase domain / Dihydroxyacetone kinase-like protein, kinase domain n=1 Tax=uncultured Rubrobacteraceae bacterium TaxID=349277 RepID=A0A6J4RN60_9ACTN|nr:MAG: Dihydroxyacetone kinase-like protein, phosphatase domain / Dihydroxyacetone kinase-like protein, kinase domain [uncultured Rubrobacteraceae bacterium]
MAIEVAHMVTAAHAAVKAQVARINDLNVYPVPDGDTGTNMLLTLESLLNETSGRSYDSPEEASRACARAALMGARGNSGVILSQMIRGACEVLADRDSLDAEAFAAGLDGARERAHASVREPVEGTMLTVIKDAALAAREAIEGGSAYLPSVAGAARLAAHDSVRRTPELLAVLREAGVIDAGGLGVAVVLDGLYACITGQEIEAPEAGEDEVPDLEAIHAQEEAWGYCTEFLVDGFDGDAEEFREHVYDSGRSVFVVADDDVVKVHVHTQDPGAALSYAGGFGRLAGVKVDDMEAQVRSRGPVERPAARLGVVVASRGEGNRVLFEQMGAVVIEGGQGKNPSAADLARAVEKTGATAVVLLPNNKNIVPTAEQVDELVAARTHVVPTTNIAAGLAVMVGYDAEGEPDEVVEEMCEISDSLRVAEITRAVRDARIGDREVPEGAYLGFLGGELVAVEGGARDAALALARKMVGDGADVLTLLKGEELAEAELESILDGIRDLDDVIEVEVRGGGQPLYPLQLVAE